jgi:hypothetical protein
VNPGVLPDTAVAYCDSTIAFPLFCEYAVAHKNGRRKRKNLVGRRGALVESLRAQAAVAAKPTAKHADKAAVRTSAAKAKKNAGEPTRAARSGRSSGRPRTKG